MNYTFYISNRSNASDALEKDINLSHTSQTMFVKDQKQTDLNIYQRLFKYHHYTKISPIKEVSMNYVTRIRNLREDSDRTQQEIADFLGTSQTMYARYERGANEMPVRHLLKLAQYYNVSLDYLCGLTNKKLPYPKH